MTLVRPLAWLASLTDLPKGLHFSQSTKFRGFPGLYVLYIYSLGRLSPCLGPGLSYTVSEGRLGRRRT